MLVFFLIACLLKYVFLCNDTGPVQCDIESPKQTLCSAKVASPAAFKGPHKSASGYRPRIENTQLETLWRAAAKTHASRETALAMTET